MDRVERPSRANWWVWSVSFHIVALSLVPAVFAIERRASSSEINYAWGIHSPGPRAPGIEISPYKALADDEVSIEPTPFPEPPLYFPRRKDSGAGESADPP